MCRAVRQISPAGELEYSRARSASICSLFAERRSPVFSSPKCGMVQKRVTAQGWLGSTPVGQRPQIRGLRAGGVLSVGIPRFLNKSQHFTVHLFRPWRPGSARGSDGGPRRFTEIVPTPHAYSGQWPVKTKRARARSCASVVTRKRPLLNRARTEPIGWVVS